MITGINLTVDNWNCLNLCVIYVENMKIDVEKVILYFLQYWVLWSLKKLGPEHDIC